MYKKIFSVVIAAFVSLCGNSLQAQIITTLAGDGTRGYGGDGNLAAYCRMNAAVAIAVDRVGNIYLCDQANNRVRKIDAFGIIRTFAGTGVPGMSGDGGLATKARVSEPGGIAVDFTGNVYISDTRNNRIRKVDTGGIITTIAGNGVAGFSGDDSVAVRGQMSSPGGLKIDKDGNIYFADTYNNRIRRVDAVTGVMTTIAGKGPGSYTGDNGPATAATMNLPQDVAVDKIGNVFFTDRVSQCVRMIDTSGIIRRLAGNGLPGFGGDEGIPFKSQLNEPFGIAMDSKGNMYVSDMRNNRVRKVDTLGVISTIAGMGIQASTGDGGLAGDATLSFPSGIAVDTAGTLFVGQSDGHIRYIYVSETGTDSIGIFPNPCREVTNVVLSSKYEELATIQIINTSGRIVKTIVGPTNRVISVKLDAAGFYVIYAVTPHNRFKGKVSAVQY